MIPTAENLKDIFYSGYPAAASWQVLDELALAIRNYSIRYERIQLVPKQTYYTLRDAVVGIDGLGPQEKGHMALKDIGRQWLSEQCHIDAREESYFMGLHPDVLSEDIHFVIECGTTDPSCVWIFLNNDNVEWIGNIPYPFDEESYLWLHQFQRGPNFQKYQSEKLQTVRDTFRKFHRT